MAEQTNASSPAAPGRAGIVRSCAVLAAVVVLAFPAFAWYGFAQSGFNGILAAVVAAGVCFGGAVAALLVTTLLIGPQSGVQGTLLGTMFRTGVPLGAAVALSQGGPLTETGVVGMILIYYLLTLSVETLLAVLLLRPACKTSKAS